MEKAGIRPYLTIGPWAHSSNGLAMTGLRESLLWLRGHIFGEKEKIRALSVRVFVMGANEWRDMEIWPPRDLERKEWYLDSSTSLTEMLPSDSQASQYIYDPKDPTPNVGGATNATFAKGAGALDNSKLEARSDVLTFTTPQLDEPVEIMGSPLVQLFVSSSLEYTDFFIRLCDVYPSGKSMNISDRLIRLTPESFKNSEDGTVRINLELSSTAYLFKRGHSIRLQVSSGAHPRYVRNLGTSESIATAKTMKTAEQRVYHDSKHPSVLILPINRVD